MSDHWFTKVESGSVPPEVLHAAENALQCCMQDLALSGVEIIWILPEVPVVGAWNNLRAVCKAAASGQAATEPAFKTNGDLWGKINLENPTEIFVRADISALEAARTVKHELRHIWQNKTGFSRNLFAQQADAEEYARKVSVT